MRLNRFTLFIFIIVLCTFVACSPKKKDRRITGTEGVVSSIENGNTIRLQNGLTVTLIGVSPSEIGKKYMEANLKGKSVRLVADSRDPKQTYRSTATTVRAYAKVPGTLRSINGALLEGSMSNGLNSQGLYDSAAVFKRYIEDPSHPVMSDPEIRSKLMPATFCLVDSNGGTGTGFIISEDGLALTNNHVMSYEDAESTMAVFFSDNGKLDGSNIRKINRIVYSNQDIDFTIFYIQLNGKESMPYIPICSKRIIEGEHIAKLGCPLHEIGNFQTGNFSNYKDDYFMVHSAGVNEGDSGGPVVNTRGEVVGVNRAIRLRRTGESANNIAYAIDIQIIKQLLDENHIAYGK